MFRVFTNNHNLAFAAGCFAFCAHFFDRCSYFHNYCKRRIILPFVKSYADIATRTRSPGITRILWTRILPERWPIISWPVSSLIRNCVLGRVSVISPSTSTVSCFGRRMVMNNKRTPWGPNYITTLLLLQSKVVCSADKKKYRGSERFMSNSD